MALLKQASPTELYPLQTRTRSTLDMNALLVALDVQHTVSGSLLLFGSYGPTAHAFDEQSLFELHALVCVGFVFEFGRNVGCCVGRDVGNRVGRSVGRGVERDVGEGVGDRVGGQVGYLVGCCVGGFVGRRVGGRVG